MDPDPIRMQGFDDQKLKKLTAEKNYIFMDQTTIYLSLGLHNGRPSYTICVWADGFQDLLNAFHYPIQLSTFYLLL